MVENIRVLVERIQRHHLTICQQVVPALIDLDMQMEDIRELYRLYHELRMQVCSCPPDVHPKMRVLSLFDDPQPDTDKPSSKIKESVQWDIFSVADLAMKINEGKPHPIPPVTLSEEPQENADCLAQTPEKESDKPIDNIEEKLTIENETTASDQENTSSETVHTDMPLQEEISQDKAVALAFQHNSSYKPVDEMALGTSFSLIPDQETVDAVQESTIPKPEFQPVVEVEEKASAKKPTQSQPVGNVETKHQTVPPNKPVEDVQKIQSVPPKPPVTVAAEKEQSSIGEKYQDKKPTLNEIVSSFNPNESIGMKLHLGSVSDLMKSIDMNNKFLFVKELFKNNGALFTQEINTLNDFKKLSEALSYLEKVRIKYGWITESEAYMELYKLVLRKFA
jgi:hypothetical protein